MTDRQKDMKDEDTEALFRKAVTAQLNGEIGLALSLYRDLLKSFPNHLPSLNNTGAIYLKSGDYASAMHFFRKALRLRPLNADAWNNLGVILARSADPARAVRCYERALRLKPDSEIYTNLGSAYKDLGRLDQAELMHRKGLELDPSNPKAYNNLALVYIEMGRHDQAIACFRKALLMDNSDEEIVFNLGEALVGAGHVAEAVSLAEEALTLFPGSITTVVGAARVFLECGLWEKADPLIEAALRYPFTVSEAAVLRHLILFLNASVSSRQDIARMHLLCGQLIEEQLKEEIEANPFSFNGRFEKSSRLRIGYVSPDFNRHSVGWFFREIVKYHDSDHFDIYCYSLSDREDDLTRDIEASVTVFRRVKRLGDRQVTRQIFEDRIQILVDLAGYTRENRLEIFALRPAPIQITAIGYPHGTGLTSMDYRITDRLAEGPCADAEYAEALIRLPCFFLPLPPFERGNSGLRKEDIGIPTEAVTMVSFNAFHKLRPEVLRLWGRIMKRVPGSHMVFSFRHSQSEFVQARIRGYLGVSPERIHFLPQTATEEEHRARYLIGDLALDPFPYSGTTTSWEALSQGVPVITLRGVRHVERTTWSLLAELGLGYLAAEDEASYEKKVVTMARDADHLAEVKRDVKRSVRAAIAKGNRDYVRELETCLLDMWKRYLKMHKGC